MTSRKRSRQAGFSYIEVLVGIVILAIVAAGITQGFAQTSSALGRSKAETTANKLATAVLDRAHRMPYADVGISGGSPPGVFQATSTQTVGTIAFTVDVDVVYVDDPALGQPQTYVNYKKVTVKVTPKTANPHTYTDSTIVAPPAIGAIAGKATIIAEVRDLITDQLLEGVPVTADLSTSPTQTRATGADGKVVFAGLEPSAISPSDPKYKYRLTVNLPSPWVTAAADAPDQAQMHLTASQAWPRPLHVFKQATVIVKTHDAVSGQPINQRTEVQVTTPSPNPLSESLVGTTGPFTFTTIAGKPIQPSASDFTVLVQADCYANASQSSPVPTGYPSNTTQVFDFALTPVPSNYLNVTLRSTAAGNPVIPAGQVGVSGGDADLPLRVRDTDASGFVRFCLQKSGSIDYVLTATAAGYGKGALLAKVDPAGPPTNLTMYLAPAASTGIVQLRAASSGVLVRLQAVNGTYDASQYTPASRVADFSGIPAGDYVAYVATGFTSGGAPTWNTGTVVKAIAKKTTLYDVP